VQRAWADLQERAGRTAQAQQGALRVAQVLHDAGQTAPAQAALRVVVERSGDDPLVAVARLRLAALALDARQFDEARQLASQPVPPAFEGLRADRLGDVHLAAGDAEQARSAYRQAYAALGGDADLRRLVEAKLNALGVDPTQSPAKP